MPVDRAPWRCQHALAPEPVFAALGIAPCRLSRTTSFFEGQWWCAALGKGFGHIHKVVQSVAEARLAHAVAEQFPVSSPFVDRGSLRSGRGERGQCPQRWQGRQIVQASFDDLVLAFRPLRGRGNGEAVPEDVNRAVLKGPDPSALAGGSVVGMEAAALGSDNERRVPVVGESIGQDALVWRVHVKDGQSCPLQMEPEVGAIGLSVRELGAAFQVDA